MQPVIDKEIPKPQPLGSLPLSILHSIGIGTVLLGISPCFVKPIFLRNMGS